MPKKLKKTRLSLHDKKALRSLIWIIGGIAVIIFIIYLISLRNTIKDISKDTSVNALTQDGIIKTVQLINTNINTYENAAECWNQKNPNLPCTEENKITEGNYVLHGDEDSYWLEGPFKENITDKIYNVSKEQARGVLGGFLLADAEYSRLIKITYKENHSVILVEVTTINNKEDSSYQKTEIHSEK